MRITLCAAFTFLFAIGARAAQSQERPFYYPAPADGSVTLTKAIRYTAADTLALSFDLYRPAQSTGPAPALIFYSLFWPEEGNARRSDEWGSWARVAAANGIVAILPELRAEPGTGNATTPARARGDDFGRLLAFLREHAAHFGIDRERLVVYSASGAVATAFPAVEDPQQTAIKAAVMYYGSADVRSFRQDIPVLYVRAGLDHPGMNAEIDKLAALAVSQNAPLTLVNYHTGHHGFESRDDDIATHRIIAQTLEFVKSATAPAYQAAIRAKHLDAVAAGYLNVGNYRMAASTFEELLRQRPDEGQARFHYAEALLADKQYGAACGQFSRMPGNFAVILPGTQSCVLAGEAANAITLLKSMPKDWLTSEYVSGLRTDRVFQPLWNRDEFKALFR